MTTHTLDERADELVSPGAGQCFDSGNGGRLMWECAQECVQNRMI
ncbi:MAG TPA: hypothetical protein VK162_09450 [Streptosporangiaceae bacterium]|nr:hypothetical protein [Streptosporangiaceae bacterium]